MQKKPVLGEPFPTVDAGIDTFGAWTTTADVNVAASGRMAFRLNAYAQVLDNHRDCFDGDGFAGNTTLRVELGPATSGFLFYEYSEDDRVVDRGVPSRLVVGGPDEPLEGFDDTFFGSQAANAISLDAHLLRGRVDHTFSDALRGNLTVQYADYDKVYQNLYPSDTVVVSGGTIPAVELDGYRDATDRQNLIAQVSLVGAFETGAVEHTVLCGIEVGCQDATNARQDNVFAANGDDQLVIPFTEPLAIPAFGFDAPSRDRESEAVFTSVYLQDQVGLTERLKVLLGLGYDRFDIDVLDRIERDDGDALDGDFGRVDAEVTPRLWVIFKPRDDVSLYASYSEAFLALSGDQFLTLDLTSEGTRPQFYENRDVGLEWELRPDLALTTAVFELERESFTAVDPGNPEQTILVEGATARGADGTDTRQTPEHMFSIWNSLQVTERLRLRLGFGATYQASFFVQEDNAVEVPGYTRIDAAAYYQLSHSVRLQRNVENLLDEDYFPDAHSNNNITTGRPLNARLPLAVDL